MSKKNIQSKPGIKSQSKVKGGSSIDLISMALNDAMRPERMDCLFVADSIVDKIIFNTADIIKEKELAVKVTPFAIIHTRKTMENLFDFKFCISDKRKDDVFVQDPADSEEPEPATADGTVWDIKQNQEEVKARMEI